MNIKFVDLNRQYASIAPEINEAIQRVLDRADFVLGTEVERFEEEFADYCEAAYAVGLDSGASALELGLQALGVGPGDDVLVPVNTFFASAAAIAHVGARPVFVDVDPITYTIDVSQAASLITPRTKAIMPVHLYGQPAGMQPIMQLAQQHGLWVVEDACQAHGARYNGQRVGAVGHVGAFSFYPGKNLGAYGDGGALVTNDAALADQVRVLRNCGQREKYVHIAMGGNHRLDTLQAAVLRVKLRYLDIWNAMRRNWAAHYDQLLASYELIRPLMSINVEHVFHLYVVQVESRDAIQTFLGSKGIATGVHYPLPLHLQPAFANLDYHLGDFPMAEQSAPRLLSLPMFAELTAAEVEYVAECLALAMGGETVGLQAKSVNA
ncbi:MAG TPA: DegT/DnrJ/EryC1/StrS family aminotransferase [Roseiflexaceae bacterium]|nr:DegT/DnrJ/EryC1/StrS family aminotransferase [Roseiflexaceae bacterium]